MSYTKDHIEHECDKCLKNVGKHNLKPVPFLYLDRNDKRHPNLGNDYRQYYVCKRCYGRVVRTTMFMIQERRK